MSESPAAPPVGGLPQLTSTGRFPFFCRQLEELRKGDNYRSLSATEHHGKYLKVNGRELLNLSSNDYLGLAGDPDLAASFLSSVDPQELMLASTSSRLLAGTLTAHQRLEERLAELYGAQAALVFNSGYHANLGILPAISDSHCLILADKLVHASIIDGMRLASARHIRFQHNNLSQLERLISQHVGSYETVIIATESIFSMDGDTADLEALVNLKNSYPNVVLYVDEAHAVGVRGQHGLGIAEELGLLGDIDILVVACGKACASQGAYVLCSAQLREMLINRARSFIFSTALPPINVLWTRFVLDRIITMSEERRHLAELSAHVRQRIVQAGFDCPSQSNIVPVVIGDTALTVRRAAQFQDEGFYVMPIRPPAVPEGSSRLRLSLMASMSFSDLEPLVARL